METISVIGIVGLVIAGFAIYILAKWLFVPSKSSLVGDPRRCLICGFSGAMKTWLSNDPFPFAIALILLCFYVVPGIVFILFYWGKYKCPNCGALGKSVPQATTDVITQ